MLHLASGHLLKAFFWARGEGKAPGRENEKERGERGGKGKDVHSENLSFMTFQKSECCFHHGVNGLQSQSLEA